MSLNKSQKKIILLISAASLFFAAGEFFAFFGNDFLRHYISLTLFLMAYVTAGFDTVINAVKNILHGQVFDENFLMTIATIGALALKQFDEAAAVMIFFLLGTFFENFAVSRSRDSISRLMDIKPNYANLLCEDHEEKVTPYDVAPGRIIIVRPGEKIPLDGIVTEGSSSVDTSALTGESIPKDVFPGDEVVNGCINRNGLLKIKVTDTYEDSTVSRILEMTEKAADRKAPYEKFITRFARYYTPFILFAALVVVFLPPLLFPNQIFTDWVYRALIFIMISCPCALVVSVPLTFFGGISKAAGSGILVKGGNYLEALSKIEIAIFDKTGTLTSGDFSVSYAKALHMDSFKLLELAAHAENYSNHPIALSIKKAYGKTLDTERIEDVKEVPGKGMIALIDDRLLYVGNENMMNSKGFFDLPEDESCSLVHLAFEEEYLGYIAVYDTIKEDAEETIRRIKDAGIKKTVMLTGDRREVADEVAKKTGIDEVKSDLLPGGKVAVAEKMISVNRAKKGGKVAFIGDGINDAPVIARADIGISMGNMGSAAAMEASDIIIMDDRLSSLYKAILISKKTLSVAKQNVVFSLAVKGVLLVLGAFGIASMWSAVFADVGVLLIAVLNALRSMRGNE
ncbi:MAG TPA: heavy metal translocating P-type ATPase [Bacillota bacterium]|nr:heavy metal translocating P-type ATPase [Bacillota bacterium]